MLLRLARRLRLPYSGGFVSGRVAGHPQPTSLLALVEVAAELGLKITAGRTDPAGLDDLDTPVVVHFAGGGGGFGILERVSPRDVELWDSRNGRRRVDREAFLAEWSGVVGLIARDDSARVPEEGFRRHRFRELLGGSGGPPALAGSKTAPALRWTIGAVLAALVVVAVAGHPPGTRAGAAALVVLSSVGLAVSTVLAIASGDHAARGSIPGCRRGKLVDCESVISSPYSKVAGIPMSEIGVSFFAAILLLVATAAAAPGRASLWDALALAYAAALPFALVLVAVQVAMRRFCTLCLAVHGVVVAGAVVAWPFVDRGWSPADAAAPVLLLGVFLSLVLFLVLPFFTRIGRLNALVTSQERAAASPFSALARLLTEPPTPVAGATCGVRLDGPPARHELTVFAHPSCAQCARTISEAQMLARTGHAEVYVAIAPRDGREPERRACAVLTAVGVGAGATELLRAYGAAKENYAALLATDPVPVLTRTLATEPGVVEGALERARELTRAAEELADEYVEGTPAVFFDGRLYPYTAPLGQLATLLLDHPALLEELRPVEARSAAQA